MQRLQLSEKSKLFLSECRDISADGFKQVFSDSYAILLFFLLWFLNRLNNDPKNIAGNTLVLSFLNPLLIPAISPLFNIAFSVSKSFSILYSDTASESEKAEAIAQIQKSFRSSTYHTILIATPLTVIPMFYSKAILVNLFAQDKEVSEVTQSILRQLIPFVIPTLFYANSSQYILASGNVNILMGGTATLVVTLFLTDAMCFGHYGFEKKGIAGAAFAYFLGAMITAIIYNVYVFQHSRFNQLKLFQSIFNASKESIYELAHFLKEGMICTAQVAGDLTYMLLLNTLSLSFGIQSQAAFGLLAQCLWLNTIVNVQIAIAAGTQLARATTDEKKKPFLTVVGAAGITVGMFSGFIIPSLILLFPNQTMQLLGNDNPEISKEFLKIMLPLAMGSSFDSGCFSVMFQARSLNDLLGSTLARMAGLLIGFVTAVTLAFATPLKFFGLCSGSPIAMVSSLLFLISRWNKGIEKQMQKPVRIANNGASFHAGVEMASSTNDIDRDNILLGFEGMPMA